MIYIMIIHIRINIHIYILICFSRKFIENMRLKYNKAAQEAGVYIVSACGFDCIPTDLGVLFTQQKFGGEVNSIETYLNLSENSSIPRPFANYGTWNSLVHSVAHKSELRELRTKLYPTKLPEFTPKLKKKYVSLKKQHIYIYIYIYIYI